MIKHAQEFLEVMDSLEPLFREWSPLSVMPFHDLCDYVAYFWNRGTISYIIDDWGHAQGVCLIKLFRNLGQFLEPFVHEPCGEFCMLVLMVADGPETMGWICQDLTRRWGPQSIVLWDRGDRTESGAPRMFTWNQFQKLARRITQGVTTNV